MKTYKVDGKRLRETREKKRLSRAVLAEKVGCSDKTILRAEMGEKLKIGSIDRIASILELQPKEIIDEPIKEVPKSQYASFTTLALWDSSNDFLYVAQKELNNISDRQRLPDTYSSNYTSYESYYENKLKEEAVELKELEWAILCPVKNEIAELISSLITSCRKFLHLDWQPEDSRFVNDAFTGETADILRLGLIGDNLEKLKERHSIYVTWRHFYTICF